MDASSAFSVASSEPPEAAEAEVDDVGEGVECGPLPKTAKFATTTCSSKIPTQSVLLIEGAQLSPNHSCVTDASPPPPAVRSKLVSRKRTPHLCCMAPAA